MDQCGNNIRKRYIREIGIPLNVEAYIQSRGLKKTLESILFDPRCNHIEGNDLEGEVEEEVMRLTMTEEGKPEPEVTQETKS